jgi:predicted permease
LKTSAKKKVVSARRKSVADNKLCLADPKKGGQMSNSRYRWVIVAAGGLLGCVAIGAMFSLPVFLGALTRDTGWSVTGVSSAMTIGFLALALTSMLWGNLSEQAWGLAPS